MKKTKFVHLKSLNVSIQRFAEVFCTLIFVAVLSFDTPCQNSGCCNSAAGYQVAGYAQISPDTYAVPAQITPNPGGTQTVLINTPVATTIYSVTGASAAMVTGLPAGVVYTWASGAITISGIPVESGTFDYEVIADGSCGTTTSLGTIVVLSGTEYVISGKTRYLKKAIAGNPAPNNPAYNSVIYNIDPVIVILKTYPAGIEMVRDTSNSSGIFEFTNVTNGTYMLSYDKYAEDTMQYVNHVNSVDLALLKYYIGHNCLTDPSRCFSEKHIKAANVDNNLSINTIDVARISAKIGSPYDPARNFPKGNWVTLDTSVTVSGADLNITLQTAAYGDYDASSYRYKDSANNWSMTKVLPDDNIILRSDESMTINDPEYFEVPLRISTKMNELAALGLELAYPNDKYKLVSASMSNIGKIGDAVKINPTLEEIIAANNDLLVTDDRGIIRVVFATTDHFDIAANDELIRLGFLSLNDQGRGELDFNLNGTGLIANQYGEINEDAYLTMPKIFVQGDDTEAGFEFAAYPNPFRNGVTLTFAVPANGSLVLKVYNALGALVAEPVNGNYAGGKHTVVFSQQDLPAGMYSFKLDFFGAGKSKSMVLNLTRIPH
ncbi:MAG TPA: T9SS type A sorting domain-containing protein [Bacteroidales bacterium]|nr:T9SS type A sorting domain-containing protein [Bacteroidales bacterium]